MNPVATAVRLSFVMPSALRQPAAVRGPFGPFDGCTLEVNRAGLVVIEGPSRERVQDLASRYLRVVARDVIAGEKPPLVIPSIIRTYHEGKGAPGRDSWQIIVGADIAFAPTGIEPYLPESITVRETA
jgi:hypothetical protein